VILSNGVITQPLTAQNVQVGAILFCTLTTYSIYFGRTMNYALSEVVLNVVKYDKAIVAGNSVQVRSRVTNPQSAPARSQKQSVISNNIPE
jgi:hypothetical protein